MSEIKYTPAQEQVIEIRDRNVLVSAAAGSGKTAVLTARIVDRLCDDKHPVSIDRMLIVTFTDAAATEMRERIGKAISERLLKEPGNVHLRKQQTLVHTALIMTVHGFCLYLIRNHFDAIGIDPSFRVAADEETKLILEESIEQAVSEMQQNDREGYELLWDHFTPGFYDTALNDVLKKVHYAVQSEPFPEDWFEEMKLKLASFSESPEKGEAYAYAFRYETELLSDIQSEIRDMIALSESDAGPKKYLPALKEDFSYVESLLAASGLKERGKIHAAHSFPRLGTEKESPYREYVKSVRDRYKKILSEKIIAKLYLLPFEEACADDVKTAAVLQKLLELSENLYRIYGENKRKKNLIDFSDMEHFALKILIRRENGENIRTEVAEGYRRYFEEVMVDEYQDSNYIQETLLEAVSNITEDKGNRFMVGDVKQSIYRFRLARPEIFRKKYNSFSMDQSKRDVRIDLSSNFRSRTEVLESVNRVMKDCMHESVGEIDYDENAALSYGAKYYGEANADYRSELLVLNADKWKETPIKDKTIWQSMVIANRIKLLMEEGFQVTDHVEDAHAVLRPVRYSDIVILVRSAKNRTGTIKSTLEALDIPTMVISREGYFMAPEVILLLNIISVIDNPRQDIPLLGVLHSVFGNFTENELAQIKGKRKELLLWDALTLYSQFGGNVKLRFKVSDFIRKLDSYRELAARISVYELLIRILDEEGIGDYYRALRFGEQRIANIRILLQKAEEYASTGYTGLFDFIRYIETVRNKDIDFGEANIEDENADVVRIFTMHKSKGLEFPVCFLFGIGDSIAPKNSDSEVAIDDELGITAEYADLEKRIRHKSLSRTAVLLKDSKQQRGEDLRILYVAMTRAKEKLILTGCISGKKLNEEAGENRPFRVTEVLSASSYMDFLLPEAKRNPDLFDLVTCEPVEEEQKDFESSVSREMLKQELLSVPAGKAFVSKLYPHKSLREVFTKTCVTELKSAAFEEENEGMDELYKEKNEEYTVSAYVPDFMRKEEKNVSGALFGTAHHRIMELLPFDDLTDEDFKSGEEILERKVERMRQNAVTKEAMSADENELIKTTNVVKFLGTPLALRMKKAYEAGKLYREQPFVISLPASDVNKAFPSEEKVLLQGVIDAYFEEDGELVLLDYKTDAKVDEEELMKRHGMQLMYYKNALERLEKKKVKEVYIYSFYLGKEIRVDV